MVGFTNEMIGQTTIDLEDRFYSRCYARCGIPQVYEETGHITWRDSKLPSQILQLLCRENHMPLPVFRYDKDELIVYIENPGLKQLKNPKNYFDHVFKYSVKEEVKREEDNFNSDTKERAKLKEKLSLKVLNDWKNITKV